ncbi:MAG: hypothetical protein PVJ60_00595 [Phycisphaerales bacterium]|jgi:hypothetical protein
MSLIDSAIIELADLERPLNVDSTKDNFPEEFLENLINSVTEFIEKETNNKFITGSDTYEFEGNGQTKKRMRYAPIVGNIDVTNISYWDKTQWTALDSAYTISNDNKWDKGILEFTNGYRFSESLKWKVVYSYGYARQSIPWDLKAACIGLVGLRFKLFNNDKLGISTWSRSDQAFVYEFNKMPEWIRLTLNQYKRFVGD